MKLSRYLRRWSVGLQRPGAPLSVTYDVGIIPTNKACPTSSQVVWIYTDDEDSTNENKLVADAAWITDARRIVVASSNTRVNMAEVYVVR